MALETVEQSPGGEETGAAGRDRPPSSSPAASVVCSVACSPISWHGGLC